MTFFKKSLISLQMIYQKILAQSLLFSVLLSACLFAVLYPGIFFFLKSPMGVTSWELQDPIVSHMNFVPGIKVLQYELFHRLNFLWTPLRNLGTPLLANEIQVAPLFPLTLLWIWAPPALFWNLLITSRVILTGTIACLFSIQILKFTRFQSFVFTLTFVFGLYGMRWMNHPWQNGLLAGLLYLYSLAITLNLSNSKLRDPSFFWTMFQTFSVYSLITCGFPEGAALGVVLAWLVLLPLIFTQFSKNKGQRILFFKITAVAHFIGFGLGSAQIFSLVEYMQLAGHEFRISHGRDQFNAFNIFWKMVTRFNDLLPSPFPVHFFGLIPLSLFSLGILSLLGKSKKMNRFDFAALLTGLFYFLKCFKVWPLFNQWVGSLPILRECLFTIYFFPILLWFFSYFCAKGALDLFQRLGSYNSSSNIVDSRIRSWKNVSPFLFSIAFVALLFLGAAHDAGEIRLGLVFSVITVFGLFIWLTIRAHFQKKSQFNRFIYLCLLILFMLAEFKLYQPGAFIGSRGGYKNSFDGDRSADFFKALSSKYSLNEIRERSNFGDYLADGLATPDNGASAILTDRAKKLRTTLFIAAGDGYLPIDKAKVPYAWNTVSAGAYMMDKNALSKLFNVSPSEIEHLQILGNFGLKTGVFDDRTLPRAYVPTRCLSVATVEESINKLSDEKQFKAGDAVLENLDYLESASCKTFTSKLQRVPIFEDSGTRVLLGSVQGPNILILNDSYYPGWHAVDRFSGKELEIKPANINFRGVLLPENRNYQIQFRYYPVWLNWSAALFIIALFAISALAYRSFRLPLKVALIQR